MHCVVELAVRLPIQRSKSLASTENFTWLDNIQTTSSALGNEVGPISLYRFIGKLPGLGSFGRCGKSLQLFA